MAVERGDIYHIDVLEEEHQGHELWGPHWWVVLSIRQINDKMRLFTAVPLTSVINKETGEPKDKGPFRYFHIRILESSKIADPGLSSAILKGESIVLTEQTRVFSSDRITSPRVGRIDVPALAAIEAGLFFVLGKGIGSPTPKEPAALKVSVPIGQPAKTPGMPAAKK